MQALTTESAIRNAVVRVASGEVGKHFGVGNPTPYGAWYGPGWNRAYFCAAGASWSWNMAVGEVDARHSILYQTQGGVAPHRRGFIWTVAWWNQLSGQRVGRNDLDLLKPGDILFYKYPTTGDRNSAVVNHADVVKANYPSPRYLDCIGFNVPRPGAPPGSDQSLGGGNWRRRTYYNNRYIVGGIRINAKALANRSRSEWSRIQNILTDLGLANLQGTGTVGPATTAGVREYAKQFGYTGHIYDRNSLLPHMEATMSDLTKAVNQNSRLLERVLKELGTLGSAVNTVREQTTRAAFHNNVKTVSLYGTSLHYYLRNGLILDPEHRNFPADPESFAYKLLRSEAIQSNGYVRLYMPSENQVILLKYEEDGKFVLVDDEGGR